jgi:hypothetical protein
VPQPPDEPEPVPVPLPESLSDDFPQDTEMNVIKRTKSNLRIMRVYKLMNAGNLIDAGDKL